MSDVVEVIQSPERLRLLLVLTAADIRAVGPNVWNGWKGQLLRDLYHETDAALAGGDGSGRRGQRIEAAKAAFAEALADWPKDEVTRFLERHDPRYWIGFDLAAHHRHALLVRRAEAAGEPLTLDFMVDRFRARTEMVVFAPDHPGLFMQVAGALALSGASHRRRADLHHQRRHGARQLRHPERRGPRRGRRPGPAAADPQQRRQGAGRRDPARSGARGPPLPAQARRRVRGRAARAGRQQRQPHADRDRDQRPRPAGPALRSRQEPEGPRRGDRQRPHQHLWRARGRRVLRQGRVRAEDQPGAEAAADPAASGGRAGRRAGRCAPSEAPVAKKAALGGG